MVLQDLINDARVSHNHHRRNGIPIVHPSIPILYFGDKKQYHESALKIITVGLSPSHNEFPVRDRFDRFKNAENLDLTQEWSEEEVDIYLNSLNNYFKHRPYNWFDSFEPILNGIHASYYPNTEENRALHTDICSPHATSPTWSKLGESHQDALRFEGERYWHRLVETLKPDIVLVSVARKYLNMIRFRKTRWKVFTSIFTKKDGSPRSKPYDIEIAECEVGDNKGFLVFGQAAQLPFGTLSTGYKGVVGERLLELGK